MTPNRDANNQAAHTPAEAVAFFIGYVETALATAKAHPRIVDAVEREADRLRAAVASPTSPHEAETPAAAMPRELTKEEASATYYQGNSVSHIKAKATTYGDAVMQVWFVLKKHGKHPGRTDDTVWAAVDAALASHRAAPVEAETPGCGKNCQMGGFCGRRDCKNIRPKVEARTTERHIAMREAHCIAALDAYFAPRPVEDGALSTTPAEPVGASEQQAEQASDAQDARRYRWLREKCAVSRRDFALRGVGIDAMFWIEPLMFCEGEEALKQLDAAIDAAITKDQA